MLALLLVLTAATAAFADIAADAADAAAAATATACASALQLQDTVRSSLRSENTAISLRDLVADHRVTMQKLKDAIDNQGRATEEIKSQLKDAIDNQGRATEKSFDIQARAIEKITSQLDFFAYIAMWVGIPIVVFTLVLPGRAVAILKAYAGLQLQHAP